MIEVSGISKRYGRREILNDVTFHVSCGESVAIIGKNGCGKSTLLRILAGVCSANQGQIRFFGKDPQKKKRYFQTYCGYVPQENPLMEELSVQDNLRLWGADRSLHYKRLLQSFQLQDILHQTVQTLSGGMKRRLSIACALAGWPPILLLDEPTTALDLYYKDSIQEWMQEYCSMNGILLLVTHEESEILECDRCLVLEGGRMSELPKEKITHDTLKQYFLDSLDGGKNERKTRQHNRTTTGEI